MKKQIEDELIDGLLTEHAAGSDEGEFMKELKERLSDVEGESSSDVVSQRSRWKIPVAVASGAVAASLVFVAWQHLLSEDPTDVGPIPKVSDVPMDDPDLAQVIKDAIERLSTGDGAFLENDFEQAMADYQAAVDGMEDVEGAEEFLAKGMEKLNAAATNVARIRMDAGDYASAGKLVREVLDRDSEHPVANMVAFQMTLEPGASVSASDPGELVRLKVEENLNLIGEAEQLVANGDRAYVDQNYEQAVADYEAAVRKLPEAPIADMLKEVAVAKFADASVHVAHLRADQGRYAEARTILESVLAHNPDHEAASIELEQLIDPEYRNGALSPEHVLDVEEIENSLQTGISFYDLGDFDEAGKHFEKVLRIDPTNSAARRMMTKVEDRKLDYLAESRLHTRTKMLREVAEAWETPVPPLTELDFGGNDVSKDQISRRQWASQPGALHRWGFSKDGLSVGYGLDASLEEAVPGLADLSIAGWAIHSDEEASGSQYAPLVENIFQDPLLEATKFSTFSVDVDTASYCNIRGGLRAGESIPKDAIRLEEIVNYFDYDYAKPEGEHPFAVHIDSASCPWDETHRLVRIGLQGEDIDEDERPPANLVFLIDVSGSMSDSNKLPLVRESLKMLVKELNEGDTVSLVVYANASGQVLAPTQVKDGNRGKILEAIERLEAGGSTAGGEGIQLAYTIAKKNFVDGGVNRVILATDGDFNVGISDTDELTELVKEKAKSGIYLSALGFGRGNLNDAMMESITNNGNGNYFYIDSAEEGAKVLSKDMLGTVVTIAKDVKVQVAFNPKKVKSYRLLGYANRMLKAEDFHDKRVDAGEIGSGHTVTALYEVVPAEDTPLEDRVGLSPFEKAPDLKDMDELVIVKLAYKGPEADAEAESTYFQTGAEDSGKMWTEASADFKFAAAAGLFGMVMRDSPHKGDGDLLLVKHLALEGKGKDESGWRKEFAELVDLVVEKTAGE